MNDNIISDDKEPVNTFKTFFGDVIKHFKVQRKGSSNEKITFCSEFPDILDKAGRNKKKRTHAIIKRFAFHANAKRANEITSIGLSLFYQIFLNTMKSVCMTIEVGDTDVQ